MLQTLKYSVRLYRRMPAIAVICILTLALGIGASTIVFSVVDSILLKPLPYPNAGGIVMLWRQAPQNLHLGYDELPWGPAEFRSLSRETQTFSDTGAFQGTSFNLTGSGEPMLLDGLSVTTGFFRVLGVKPDIGRIFQPNEDEPGHDREAILSYQLWRNRFSRDRTVLGTSIDLNGSSYTVIGVMPPGFAFPHASEMPESFEFPHATQIWVPLALPTTPEPYQSAELAVMGLLRPGVSLSQARAALRVFAAQEDREFPKSKGWFNSKVTALRQQLTGSAQRPLLLLLAAVGLVLLIACSNVANLLLAGSVARTREFTLRAALGASKLHLIKQLLAESIFLAGAGGVLGMGVSLLGIYLVRSLGSSNIPRLQEVGPNLTVFTFACLVTLGTGILFGLAPALSAIKVNLVESLKQGGPRSGGGRSGNALRSALVLSEVAIAVILVISAGLLVRTFAHLLSVDPGFNPDHVLTFELSLPSTSYPDNPHMVSFYDRVLQTLDQTPGIKAAGVVEAVPMEGATESTIIRIPEHPGIGGRAHPLVDYTIASPGYFRSIGTPLIRGREFLPSDNNNSQAVTIVNQSMATKFWPKEDAIGKQVIVPSAHTPLVVIGVSRDIKRVSMNGTSGPEMYVPYSQNPWPPLSVMQVVVRTQASPDSVIGAVREVIHGIDSQLPVAKVATMTNIVSESMAEARFSMLLLSAFGVLALVLASVGMYGVISYSVVQRTPEIGVRMALGAQRSSIFQMVLASAMKIAGMGILMGLIAASLLTQFMSHFLYGIAALDLLTFISVSIITFGVVVLACYLPALRATKTDPLVAIRYE